MLILPLLLLSGLALAQQTQLPHHDYINAAYNELDAWIEIIQSTQLQIPLDAISPKSKIAVHEELADSTGDARCRAAYTSLTHRQEDLTMELLEAHAVLATAHEAHYDETVESTVRVATARDHYRRALQHFTYAIHLGYDVKSAEEALVIWCPHSLLPDGFFPSIALVRSVLIWNEDVPGGEAPDSGNAGDSDESVEDSAVDETRGAGTAVGPSKTTQLRSKAQNFTQLMRQPWAVDGRF
jgi:hypothetical protein